MTDALTLTALEASEDLGDLLLEVLPPDGSTMGNLSAREALSRAAERPISEEDYEAIRDKALALGLVVKGHGRGGSIALAEGIEGGSRYEAPTTSAAGNGRARAKKEAPAKDFKAVLWASLESALRDYILLITILVAFLEATAQQLRPIQPPVVMGSAGVIRQEAAG